MSLGTRNAKTIEEFQNGIRNIQVLSALNTKYFILGADMPPVENLEAFGPALVCGFVRSRRDSGRGDRVD